MIFDGVFQYLSMLNDMFGVWSYYLHTHRCNDFKDKKHNKDCRILYGARLVREGISIAYGGGNSNPIALHLLQLCEAAFCNKVVSAEKEGLIDYYDANNEKEGWKFLIKEATKQSFVVLYIFIRRIGT